MTYSNAHYNIKNVVWIQPFIRGMYNSNRSTNNYFVVGTPCNFDILQLKEKVDTNSPEPDVGYHGPQLPMVQQPKVPWCLEQSAS